MKQNLHRYKNLGLACARLSCPRCHGDRTFSLCLQTDSKRRKAYSFGCSGCGWDLQIDEARYEQLYELSFEFERVQAGKRSWAELRERAPEDCRRLFERIEASAEPGSDPVTEAETREDREPAKSWPKPGGLVAESQELLLINTVSDTFGIGYLLAVLLGGLLLSLKLFLGFPAGLSGVALLGLLGFGMGLGFAGGVALSWRRFPKRIRFSGKTIEIEPRGKTGRLRYELSDVSRVNYGSGAKYLTLWLDDGNTFVVRAGSGAQPRLDRFFGKQG
ncbi:hypothetical protein [Pelagicoccus sp. SDUM812005]|uniref:hypothetical protein n=1 Tax=Pelagicoccus sp. SDUM812005 TaxID=3041257 RepID=UPI00280F0930|nr:hypothetical protein [Pelagicoccus sp. SDUM812005]MDQ8182166.1 hypothetical protein [Pelagicoccus sp. SDUM812005]